MQRVILQENIIQTYLDVSNSFYQDLLGYKPEQTSLQQISNSKWNLFCKQFNLNQDSSGIFLPRNQTAIIRDESPLSLFHEYFGHGLYCEQNLAGRELVNLEKRLLEEERQEFSSRGFSLEDLQKFRKQNQTFQELQEFKQENLGRYELFAIWTEYLLSGENGLRKDFERKYDSLQGQEKKAIDSIINFSKEYGNLATMYAQGMARRTTSERVKKLLEDVYKDKLNDVRFALLYGSRKEFSDIDVFIVSDNLLEIKTNWLDVRVCKQKDFEERIKFFDVSVADPLLTGDIFLGDKDYFTSFKEKLFKQSITEKAIKHNLEKSKEQKRLALTYPENSHERKHGLAYSLTYLTNALMLKQGKRILTKEKLLDYLQKKFSLSENHIKLKGGINREKC